MASDQEKTTVEKYRALLRAKLEHGGDGGPALDRTIELDEAEATPSGELRLFFLLQSQFEIQVCLTIAGDRAVYLSRMYCDKCRSVTPKSCPHWMPTVMNFTFWDSTTELDEWLDYDVPSIPENRDKPTRKVSWPYICFKVKNSRLRVSVTRTKETIEDGRVVSAQFNSSISPKQLLSEATRKPHGDNRDILLQFADALSDFIPLGDGKKWWLVPEISAGSLLATATKYSNAVLRSEDEFFVLIKEAPLTLEYNWTVDEHSYTAHANGLNLGTFFYRSVPMIHLSDDGVITPIELPANMTWRDARAIERLPPITVESAQESFRKIHDRWPAFPLPPADKSLAPIDIGDQRLTNILRIVRDEQGFTVAQLSFRYLRGVEIDRESPALKTLSIGDKNYRVKRNLIKEQRAFEVLKNHGLEQIEGDGPYTFASEIEVDHWRMGRDKSNILFWAGFIDNDIPILKAQGWRVFLPKKEIVEFIDCPVIAGCYEDDPDNKNAYKMTLGIEVNGEVVSLLPLVSSLLGQYGWEYLDQAVPKDSEYAHLDMGWDRVIRIPGDRLRTILKMVSDSLRYLSVERDAMHLPLQNSATVGLLDEKLGDGVEWKGSGRVQRLVDVFNGFSKAPLVDVPATIVTTLERYQHEGVSQIAFMAEHGFPMLLCDEMGLGKTLQLLTSYAIAKDKDPSIGPVLVMVNTAGLNQWIQEVQRHCPSLRVAQTNVENGRPIAAGQRHKYYDDCENDRLDVLVSTYGKIYNDIERVIQIKWHTVFADEAQIVNNPTSKRKRKFSELEFSFLYPATGTPIENNLMELWSLFDLSMRGYLGTRAGFRREFAKPIEVDQNPETLYRLKKLIAPFVRRKLRSDGDVDLNIPDPRVELRDIELTGAQRDLYESVRVVQEETVRELLKKQGVKQATSMVINAILGMRQIVCDPTLYTRQDHGVVESAKMNAMEQLLDEFKKDGRQALVFTNFEMMMPLFTRSADRCGVSHSIISGKVTKRDPIISDYKSGNHQILFATLGTMNASIDLYNAKAVVIYEPWWNPQKENQGIGRMVRRGQEDETTVYRLVAQQTVERQLMKKQDKKLALVDAIFAEDLEALNTGLSEEDVRGLFAPSTG